jgi:hypothetical protein
MAVMAATLKLTHRTIGVEVRRGTYDVVVVAFRCGGKRPLPIFLASFVVPSLALSLSRQ